MQKPAKKRTAGKTICLLLYLEVVLLIGGTEVSESPNYVGLMLGYSGLKLDSLPWSSGSLSDRSVGHVHYI